MTIVNRVPVLACVWCCLMVAVPLAQAPADAPGDDAPAAGPSSVLHVDDVADQIVHVNTRVRHTTVIQLPPTEQILDFVVGDSEYWFVSGSANLAFVKPIAEGVTTNVALICESGTIYSFLVTERTRPPHLVVRVGAADDRPIGAHVPAFVARSRVADFQAMADESRAAVQAIQAEAEAHIIEAQQTATAQIDQFRATYPTHIQFPYALEDKAADWPFLVHGMWHDGQFTYLRSDAQEVPALYEQKEGDPSLVPYDLQEDGLFIVRRLIGRGWLQIGRERAGWRVDLDDLVD